MVIEAPISFHLHNKVGLITLQRQEVLNSLNFEMIAALKKQLLLWKEDPEVQYILLKSSSDKAFCAGGDLKEIFAAAKKKDSNFLHSFFQEEYSLNQLIFSYPKPYISLMGGITMGGGMGISVHGSYRILSDHSLLAMPEVFIGFFPDVGASYFLNQCPGKIGLLLGLSGYRMNAADALYTNIATHYVSPDNLALLENAFLETDIGANPREGVQAILEIFSSIPPMGSKLEEYRAIIDDIFAEEDIDILMARLKLSKNLWIKDIKDKLDKASPLSLKVTHHLLRSSKGFPFEKAMALELKLALKFFDSQDVLEGIRSVVIDKDRLPKWGHSSLSAIPDNLVSSYFV